MRHQAVRRSGPGSGAGLQTDRIGDLALQIGRLVGHRAYAREQVVSSMLLRFLPNGMRPWQGADDMRRRLDLAGLDQRALDHLSANVATEIAMAHARS